MENRIQQLFEHKKGNILSIYFTAGYPQIDDTRIIIKELDRAGSDLIEIGIPFSDPLADGPVIQQSGQQALENGMTLALLFEQLQHIREETNIPLVLMGYFNVVLQFGIQQFCEKCNEVGIDGVIIPDLPLDHYESEVKSTFDKYGLINVLLITPMTSDQRIRKIDLLSNGFIYMVSSNSITGQNGDLDAQEEYFNRVKKLKLTTPTLIGFGIHDRSSFQYASSHSNGAIIGTAFIKALQNCGSLSTTVTKFIKDII